MLKRNPIYVNLLFELLNVMTRIFFLMFKTRKLKLSYQLKVSTLHVRYFSSISNSVTSVLFLIDWKGHA